ncbi:HAD family phosphatase [Salipiger sp. P9]|uniref:HAD family hydrolase n=1 Tax=Salipiger pentaromativorans TaxID=2943193 RepID=UPI0021586FDF|nr:HAD family phosphatase [Salipiger pentaromativorans]MCR8549048.1 HAD family phosphatase [Salipiger pentaromativorans]
MGIEAVVFDIGNVLIEWQPERYYDRTIGEDRRRAMFAEVDLHGMNERVDAGEDFREVIYDTAETYPGWRDEIRQWHDNWIELAAPEIPGSVRLLRALRGQGIPVFALSNIGEGTLALGRGAYPFLSEFDREYISGAMKVTKPNPRIYELVEADCGLAPETLLFADDRAENIAAAEARGWQGHQFRDAKGWADCLVSYGLLPEGIAV